MKNLSDLIGYRTCDTPACSEVPQLTVPPRTSDRDIDLLKSLNDSLDMNEWWIYSPVDVFTRLTVLGQSFVSERRNNPGFSVCDVPWWNSREITARLLCLPHYVLAAAVAATPPPRTKTIIINGELCRNFENSRAVFLTYENLSKRLRTRLGECTCK